MNIRATVVGECMVVVGRRVVELFDPIVAQWRTIGRGPRRDILDYAQKAFSLEM